MGDPSAPPPTDPSTPPPTGEGDPPPTVTEEEVEEIATQEGLPFADVVEALADLGIEVETEDIPESEYDRYDKILRKTHSATSTLAEEVETLRASHGEIEAFKQRLQEKPESVLLTLAVTKPQVFDKVKGIVEKMTEDPEYRDLVLRELEVEAREAQVDARSQRFTTQQLTAKARRADAATRSAAVRHGVDPSAAETLVAAAVREAGPERFDLSQIDAIVAKLKPRNPAPKAPRAASPAAAARAAAAPKPPAASPPAAPARAPSPDIQNMGGALKSLVRGAAGRVDSALRGG